MIVRTRPSAVATTNASPRHLVPRIPFDLETGGSFQNRVVLPRTVARKTTRMTIFRIEHPRIARVGREKHDVAQCNNPCVALLSLANDVLGLTGDADVISEYGSLLSSAHMSCALRVLYNLTLNIFSYFVRVIFSLILK